MSDKGGEVLGPAQRGPERKPTPPVEPLGKGGDILRHAAVTLAHSGQWDSPGARSRREAFGLTSKRDQEVVRTLFYKTDGQPRDTDSLELLQRALANLQDRQIEIENLPASGLADVVYREADRLKEEDDKRRLLRETVSPAPAPQNLRSPEPSRSPQSRSDADELRSIFDRIHAPSKEQSSPLTAQLRGLITSDLQELTGKLDFRLHDQIRAAKSREELEALGVDLDQLDLIVERSEQKWKRTLGGRSDI